MGLMLIYVPRAGARYGSSSAGAGACAGSLVCVRHCCPAWGRTRVLLAEITRRPRGENKFSCRRAAGGLAAGRPGQKAEIWDGFPRASSWLQSPQNFERGISPLLHFTPLPALPLRASPPHKPALAFTGSVLVLNLVHGAVAITSHSFHLQKQRVSQKQRN